MNSLVTRLAASRVVARAVTPDGIVQEAVLAEAQRSHADLIIVLMRAHRARSWMDRDSAGEHTDLLDHSSLPVLMVDERSPH